jgi:hypothetical protein
MDEKGIEDDGARLRIIMACQRRKAVPAMMA